MILKTTTGGLDVSCDVLDVSPVNQSFGPNGGTGDVTVSTTEGCRWTATGNATWIHITSRTSGDGPGTIQYSVDVNYGNIPRIATISVAGASITKTITVTQAFAVSRPRISSVVAQFDGNSDPNISGFYIPSIELINTFTASVFDPDGTTNISVRFRLFGHNGQPLKESTDNVGSDGWQATFDMKDLAGTSPAKLEVQALDESGFHSEPVNVNIEFMDRIPNWITLAAQKGRLEAHFDTQTKTYQFNLNFGSLILYDKPLSEKIPLIGGKRNRIELKSGAEMNYGIDRKNDDSDFHAGVDLTIIGKDKNLSWQSPIHFSSDLEHPSMSFNKSMKFSEFGLAKPKHIAAFAGIIDVSLDFSGYGLFTLNLIANVEKTSELTIANGSFTQLGIFLAVGVIGELDVGIATATASATANTDASLTQGFYQDQTGSFVLEKPEVIAGNLVLELRAKVCIGKSWWKVCPIDYDESITLIECIFCDESAIMPALRITHLPYPAETEMSRLAVPAQFPAFSNREALIPEVLQTPVFTTTGAFPMMVWMHDDDMTLTKPQVYIARWLGNKLSNPQPITSGEFLRMDPAVASVDSSTVITAWTQNLGKRGEPYSSTEVLANQEIFAAVGNISSGSWNNPVNVSQNALPDGKVQLAGSGGGSGLAVWTHQTSMAQDLNPVAWDIFYSFYQNSTNSWSKPQAVTNAAGADFGVSVTYGRDKYIAVWLHDNDGDLSSETDQEIQTATFDLQNMKWSQPRTISRSQFYKRDQTVAVTNFGRPVVAWREDEIQSDSSSVSKILYTTANAGVTAWTEPRSAYETNLQIKNLNLAMLPHGALEPIALSWREMIDAGGEIMVSFARLGDQNPVWTKSDTLTSDSLVTWMSAMSIDNNNNLIVAYAKTIFGDSLLTAIPTDLGNYADNLDVIAKGIGPDLTLLPYLNTQPVIDVPTKYMLEPNYPNPFKLETEIRFALPEANHVVLKIFNVVGQEIRTLADAGYQAGYYSIRWDGKDNNGKDARSGVYFYQLRTGNHIETRTMILMR